MGLWDFIRGELEQLDVVLVGGGEPTVVYPAPAGDPREPLWQPRGALIVPSTGVRRRTSGRAR